MTRQALIKKLREMSHNQFFLACEVYDDGFHVDEYDLSRMNQSSLEALLKQVNYSVTDKGIWFHV